MTAAISPEVAFRRALSLARCRDDVSMATVLDHPIGSVPMVIFHADGTKRNLVISWKLKSRECMNFRKIPLQPR